MILFVELRMKEKENGVLSSSFGKQNENDFLSKRRDAKEEMVKNAVERWTRLIM